MDAVVDLTGGVAIGNKEITADMATDEFWNEINTQIHKGYMLGVAMSENLEHIAKQHSVGLLTGHQYTILDSIETKSGHKLLKIRNPWGCREWKGRWSDGSKEWTTDIIQEVNATFGDDGTFYMCFEDFCHYWSYIDGVRLFNDPKIDQSESVWNLQIQPGVWREGGYFNSRNPQYILHLESQADVCLSLLQYDSRYVGDEKENEAHVALYLMHYTGSAYDPKHPHLCDRTFDISNSMIITKSKFRAARENTLEVNLTAGTYVVVACTYKNQDQTPFVMRAFVRLSKFQFTALPPQEEVYGSVTIDGEWNDDTAGGCSNTWKWIKNRQYLLSVSNSEPIDLSLSLQQSPSGDKLFAIGGILLEVHPEDTSSPVTQVKQVSQLRAYCTAEKVDNLIKNVQPHKKMIYVPTTFSPNEKARFKVTLLWRKDIHPACQVTITPLHTTNKSIRSEWTSEKSGGCSNYPDTWLNNPQFELHVDSTAVVNLSLVQSVCNNNLTAIGFYIFENETSARPLAHTNFAPHEACHFSMKCSPNRKYIIMPCTFERSQIRSFELLASSSSNISLIMKP